MDEEGVDEEGVDEDAECGKGRSQNDCFHGVGDAGGVGDEGGRRGGGIVFVVFGGTLLRQTTSANNHTVHPAFGHAFADAFQMHWLKLCCKRCIDCCYLMTSEGTVFYESTTGSFGASAITGTISVASDGSNCAAEATTVNIELWGPVDLLSPTE